MHRRLRWPPAVIVCALAACLGCMTGCSHGAGRNSATAAPSAVLSAEQRDVDEAVRHVPDAQGLVDSYVILDERLTVSVDAGAWERLGTSRQDAFKRAMWRAWADSYRQHGGAGGERIFFTVNDTAGNTLGSYFEH